MSTPFQVDQPIFVALRFLSEEGPGPEAWAERLRRAGIKAKVTENDGPEDFAIALEHAEWGKAELRAMSEAPRVDDFYFLFSQRLDDEERDRYVEGGWDLTLIHTPVHKNLLRDKKVVFRFARAILGDDEGVMVDSSSTLVWHAEDLDTELMHNADLDVESLYAIHAVSDDGETCSWLHTHGVAELGGFDIDILRPSESFTEQSSDVIRAMVFMILEGALAPDENDVPMFQPGGEIRLVPVRDFHRAATPKDAAAREADEWHTENRSVICDPGKKSVRSAQCLQKEMPESYMSPFSKYSTDLMAERAKATAGLFRSMLAEFADLGAEGVAKFGYKTDEARNTGGDDCEHLWFQVHAVKGDTFDCTLLNEPFEIQGMHEGDRGMHKLSDLTDWSIGTPAGAITPRSMSAAHHLRGMPPEARADLAQKIREMQEE
jgi:uncharacterized protein YegJ (DUF2314 family)